MTANACGRIALATALLFAASRGGSSPTAPPPPAGKGSLLFVDSGCACVNPPYPPVPVFIDGTQAGLLPVFGKLVIDLTPGPHTWPVNTPALPTTVTIQAGVVTNVAIMTNLSCADGCGDDMSARLRSGR